MAAPFPYTHYACPCSDLTANSASPFSKRASIQPATLPEQQLDQDRTFNPHDPRANYALYPLDRLLYCDECDNIHCPRCWVEEILYWYCPSCLFEVPTSVVKGDGNRCSRSCYNCPSCTSPLAIVAIPPKSDALLKPSNGTSESESYIMQCQFCDWSSLDIGVQFSRATKITEQLAKLRKARVSPGEGQDSEEQSTLNHDEAFKNLTTFYKEQLSESGDSQNLYNNSPYSSPANLARIMSLYGGLSYNALKKSREKPQPMREAMARSEGLSTLTPEHEAREWDVIKRMQQLGWAGMANAEQRASAPANTDARFTSQLWPAATPLRTRRGKRCRTCRQFLARPEPKVSSMRYRIRLPALNFVPRLSVRALSPASSTSAATNPSFPLRADALGAPPLLTPHELRQYVLTIRNPIEETVRISLATPATTPGRVESKVTILCPAFTVGPSGDVWDEALSAANLPPASDGSRQAAMASLTGASGVDAERQPEAGKIWERTRNSTAVVLEIVPGSLPRRRAGREEEGTGRGLFSGTPVDTINDEDDDDADLEDDDAVLEVPVFVRVEWDAEVKEGELGSGGSKASERQVGEKVRKELGYWVVLGIGKIAT